MVYSLDFEHYHPFLYTLIRKLFRFREVYLTRSFIIENFQKSFYRFNNKSSREDSKLFLSKVKKFMNVK